VNARRFAAGLALACVVAACSGDANPQVAPADSSTTTTVATGLVLREPSPAETPTTTAAAPTTTPIDDTVPESLAFASTRDIGRLFEADGTVAVLDGPEGDAITSLGDGTVVQAAAARTTDSGLVVGLVDPADPTEVIGWASADDLRPTSQFVTSSDPATATQLRQASAPSGEDGIWIVTIPGESTGSQFLNNREIAMHGGGRAITADGALWLDVIEPSTGSIRGWLPASQWPAVRSSSATNDALENTATRPDSAISYGAELPIGTVVARGCNATQIRFDNPSPVNGMAFVFGTETPVGFPSGDGTAWRASGGGTFFVAPDEAVTITISSNVGWTWHFAGLDAALQAEGISTGDGTLEATTVQTFAVDAASCVPEIAVDESDAEYDLQPAGEAETEDSAESESIDGTDTAADDEAEAEAASEPTAETDSTDSNAEEGSEGA